MKKLPILPTLAAVFCGLTALPTAPLLRAQNGNYPDGDLTVSVEELEDGGVRISVSGSTTFQGGTNSEIPQNNGPVLDRTNFSYSPPTPPATTSDLKSTLPPGLTLEITPPDEGSEADQPENGALFLPVSEQTIPLDSIRFEKGSWRLESSASGSPVFGSRISGSGSIIVSSLYFYRFVAGTFQVAPQLNQSEPENADPVTEVPGQEDFHITYEVIPFTPAPAIRLSNPGGFPATRIFRSARNRNVTLTNTGNMKLTRLALSLSGAARRDFSTSPIPVASLEAGKSTKVSVSFRPRRTGVRRALLSVMGTTELRDRIPAGEVEPSAEEVLPESVATMTVSDTVELQGTGLPIKSEPSSNSPRFPRGLYGY